MSFETETSYFLSQKWIFETSHTGPKPAGVPLVRFWEDLFDFFSSCFTLSPTEGPKVFRY
jgi:hypothetical protein